MKKLILSVMIIALTVVSCKKNEETSTAKSEATESSSELYSCPMHAEVHGHQGEACPVCGMELTEPVTQAEAASEEVKTEVASTTKSSFSVDGILNNYLKLKNTLTKDDSKAAANAAKELLATLDKTNSSAIEEKFKKEYENLAEVAKEHAEQILDNSGKIDKQREHFAMLSKDVNELIKIFGTDKKIYRDYCPMYDQGKSGYWISETKDIKNPYYGSEMLTCGGITDKW